MKKILITTTILFDEEKERNRITTRFNGEWQKLLLSILESFISNDIKSCLEQYNELPYYEEYECPGQEFVCTTIVKILEKICFDEAAVTIENYD